MIAYFAESAKVEVTTSILHLSLGTTAYLNLNRNCFIIYSRRSQNGKERQRKFNGDSLSKVCAQV